MKDGKENIGENIIFKFKTVNQSMDEALKDEVEVVSQLRKEKGIAAVRHAPPPPRAAPQHSRVSLRTVCIALLFLLVLFSQIQPATQ